MGKTELDEFLLLHELRVGTIVDDIATENGDRQWTVDFFGVGILDTTVEDEVVAVDAETSDYFPAEEDKGEDIAMLEGNERVVQHVKSVSFLPVLDTFQRNHKGQVHKQQRCQRKEANGTLMGVLLVFEEAFGTTG